jgi:hypothetical protein
MCAQAQRMWCASAELPGYMLRGAIGIDTQAAGVTPGSMTMGCAMIHRLSTV